MTRFIVLALGLTLALSACRSKEKSDTPTEGEAKMAITITSTAFEQGGMIPSIYTCDGDDISPPLAWTGVPTEAKSLVLISDDPDAPVGTWVHWVMFDIPADLTELAENLPADANLANGAKQGINDFKRHGYGGPCPPGGTHRYYFKLYALDTELGLDVQSTKQDVEQAMRDHILAQGQLMGKYKR